MSRNPETWNVEDAAFWEKRGRGHAWLNLMTSIPCLACGFATWIYWGMVVKYIQRIHFADHTAFAFMGADSVPLADNTYRSLLFTLPAVAGLAGATMRIPHTFMATLCGGRNVIFLTTLLLILPALGSGIALSDPQTPFLVLVVLAALSGIGGGAFASSMANISLYFPKRMQGLALGLNAGIGNLGVSAMQFLIPWVVTFGLFGSLGGDAYSVPDNQGGTTLLWVQNAGFVWVPVLAFLAVAAWLGMSSLPGQFRGSTLVAWGRYLWLTLLGLGAVAVGTVLLMLDWGVVPPLLKTFVVLALTIVVTLVLMRWLTPGQLRQGLVSQFSIFRSKHNWIMTYLYTMTFGSFIGYANTFPKLIDDVFGVIREGPGGEALAQAVANPQAPSSATYIWIGAGVGAAVRPLGGWLSDRFGGALVTQYSTVVQTAATIAAGWLVAQASASQAPQEWFLAFLLVFLVLFAATGIGNGSTFRMIPVIFPKEQAGAVLGWTSAIAAYGAFLIPQIFSTQIEAGTPEKALYGIAVYYASCLVLNWWYYARKGAEVPC